MPGQAKSMNKHPIRHVIKKRLEYVTNLIDHSRLKSEHTWATEA